MKLLALDTATDACSVALDTGSEVTERHEVAPRRHAALLLPMIRELLDEAGLRLRDLDALAFGRGPGSFTGLRIAAGVIQGLALGADLPVVPVSDLAVIAQGAHRERGWDRVVACLDARMGEVYWGAYRIDENGLAEPSVRDRIGAPQDVKPPSTEQWFAAGPGWASHAVLTDVTVPKLAGIDPDRLPRARDVLTLSIRDFNAGLHVGAEQALPIYLREEVAWKKKPVG